MYEYRAVVTRVVDGDTLDLDVDLGFKVHVHVRVRLLGVNTPEIHSVKKTSKEYKAGMDSKIFVEQMLGLTDMKVVVKTHKDKKGKYGRWLARIYQPPEINGGVSLWPCETLNESLIKEGLAEEYK